MDDEYTLDNFAIKSYNEIVETCKLKEFKDERFVYEVYEDENITYTCIWLINNKGYLPSTIKYEQRRKTS